MRPGDRVAVVGAGNGDDLPLRRLARRAAQLDLIDLDGAALRRAGRRRGLAGLPVRTIVEDVTLGAADAIVRGAASGETDGTTPPPSAIGNGGYDVVVADLVATQLLYPALADAGLSEPAIDAVMLRDGQPLTEAVVARLHASAPRGVVVHLHDVLGWWDGHPQPIALGELLTVTEGDCAAALALVARGNLPYGCDPRAASCALGADVVDTAFWRWPFAPGTDYLVCATVARTRPVAGS